MIIQYIKVACSFLLSLLAAVLFLRDRREERKLCMAAMILSSIGDVFMTDVLKLGAAATVPGAAFFILAHIVYAVCFFRAGKRNCCRIVNAGFISGVCLTVFAVVLLTVLMFVRTGFLRRSRCAGSRGSARGSGDRRARGRIPRRSFRAWRPHRAGAALCRR